MAVTFASIIFSPRNTLRSLNMKRVLLTLAIALLSGSLFFSIPTSAQLVTPLLTTLAIFTPALSAKYQKMNKELLP